MEKPKEEFITEENADATINQLVRLVDKSKKKVKAPRWSDALKKKESAFAFTPQP